MGFKRHQIKGNRYKATLGYVIMLTAKTFIFTFLAFEKQNPLLLRLFKGLWELEKTRGFQFTGKAEKPQAYVCVLLEYPNLHMKTICKRAVSQRQESHCKNNGGRHTELLCTSVLSFSQLFHIIYKRFKVVGVFFVDTFGCQSSSDSDLVVIQYLNDPAFSKVLTNKEHF